MNISQATHVFVSYSHADDAFVQRLIADLRIQRIPVWIDELGISAGTPDWENAVREALRKALAVILIASPQSVNSRFVRDELRIASTYKHRIYPLWADGKAYLDCIPLGYGSIQYIDARGSRYKSALDKLVSELYSNYHISPPSLVSPAELGERQQQAVARPSIHTSAFQQGGYASRYQSPLAVEKLALLYTLTGHKHVVNSVAFSPDGQIVASGGDTTIRLWEVASGKVVRTLTGHTSIVYSMAFSPDGQTLASGGDTTIRLWEVATGQELRTLTGHTSTVYSVAFSPDGQTVASGSFDTTIKLWDIATGQALRNLTGPGQTVYSVAFSPDSQTLASGYGDHWIRLWDIATGQWLRNLTGHTSYITSVAFSPGGQTLASGSEDGTIKLWGKK